VAPSRRRAVAAAAGGAALALSCVAVVWGAAPSGGRSELQTVGPAAAVAAAQAAQSQVHEYMRSVSTDQEQKQEEQDMSQKPLDWNWRPEMQRDSFVNNWVGREFVKPFRGTRPMRPLTWKEHMQHPWHAAAIAEAAKKADAVPAGVPQKDVAEAETKAEEAEAASPRSMQGLLPLKYFPHSGMGEYDTAYIMKQAQESVARAKIDPTKVEKRSLGYVRPRSDGADEGGAAAPAPATAEQAVEEQPEPGAAVEEAVESQKQPSTKLESRLSNLKKQLLHVEAEVAKKAAHNA